MLKERIAGYFQKLFFYKKHGFWLSVLTVFYSISISFIVLANITPWLYQGIEKSTDIIAGIFAYSGYVKSSDITIVYLSILLFFISYVAVSILIQYIVHNSTRFNLGHVFLIIWSVVLFVRMYNANSLKTYQFELICFLAFIAVFLITEAGREGKLTQFANVLVFGVFTQVSLIASAKVLSIISDSANQFFQHNIVIIEGIGIAIMVSYAIISRISCNDHLKKKLMLLSQLFLPLCFVYCYRFTYNANGAEIYLYYSPVFKLICILLTAVLFAFNIFSLIKNKKLIWLTSFVCIAAFLVYYTPNSQSAFDFFHDGELTVPMQQLASYGKIPFFEFIPIHGLCDYLYGIFNTLFFDGHYASFNGSAVIGSIVSAAIFAVILYRFIGNKYLALLLLMLSIPIFASFRLAMVMIFIILIPRMLDEENPIQSFWTYCVVSIIAILWNPSLGGAVTLAFLPVMLVKMIKKDTWGYYGELRQIKSWKKYLNWIPLIIIIIALLPLFHQVIIFLKENTGTTLAANSNQIFIDYNNLESYYSPFKGLLDKTGWFKYFGFFLPIVLCLIAFVNARSKKLKQYSIAILIFICIAAALTASYSFSRWDNGIRAEGISLISFLFFPAVILLASTREKSTFISAISALVIGLYFFWIGSPFFYAPKSLFAVNYVSPDYKYLTSQETGLDNWGEGFINADTANTLSEFNEVIDYMCPDKNQTFYNATNMISLYAIFDKPSADKYSSSYNTSNSVMQLDSIEELKKNPPEVVLVSPAIISDNAPFSLRNYRIYKWFLEEGYLPYQYKSIIFLSRSQNVPDGTVNALDAFSKLMHIYALDFLPISWGSDTILNELLADEKLELSSVGSQTDISGEAGDVMTIQGENPNVIFKLNRPFSGLDYDFIELDINYNKVAKNQYYSGKIYYSDENEQFSEEKSFQFNTISGCMLIPIGSSPDWSLSGEIGNIRVDFDGNVPGDQLTFHAVLRKLK